mgnify:CR=1 FL=1
MLPGVPSRLEIAATPAEALSIDADAFVVIDCLRATTTIAALFAGGLRTLWAVAEIDQAREIAARERALLFGEVGGLPPPGFDFGNSPVDARSAPVAGRDAVLFTTNGTLALTSLVGKGAVFAGAVVNGSAVLDAVAGFDRVTFVCAGETKGTRFALEDFGAAAHLAQLAKLRWNLAELGDLAILAMELTEPLSLIPRSRHAAVTRALGFERDIEFAVMPDSCPVAPRITSHGPGFVLLEVAP